MRVHVEGQLVFNNIALRLEAVLAGCGLAYLPEDRVQRHLSGGRLIRVLADWCPKFSGYHLYYPSRRQATPAFALLVNALRYRRGEVFITAQTSATVRRASQRHCTPPLFGPKAALNYETRYDGVTGGSHESACNAAHSGTICRRPINGNDSFLRRVVS